MLSNETVDEVANTLLKAEDDKSPLAPLTETYPQMTVHDAYSVQMAVIKRKCARGEVLVGRKVGLTSKAMQDMLGVSEPDFGCITSSMMIHEDEDLHVRELIQPRIEPEIAFVLERDVRGPGETMPTVLASTKGVLPSLEVIDSRIKDWKIKLQDTVADNASSARVIAGERMNVVGSIDLAKVGVVFEKNGEVISTATGAAVLGNPALAVAWLANKLSEFGTYLLAGSFVMPGSLVAALPAKRGDQFRAVFDRLGSVSVKAI